MQEPPLSLPAAACEWICCKLLLEDRANAEDERQHGLTTKAADFCSQSDHDMRYATRDTRHATCDMRHATRDTQHSTCNMQQAICDMRHATCDMQHISQVRVSSQATDRQPEWRWRPSPSCMRIHARAHTHAYARTGACTHARTGARTRMHARTGARMGARSSAPPQRFCSFAVCPRRF